MNSIRHLRERDAAVEEPPQPEEEFLQVAAGAPGGAPGAGAPGAGRGGRGALTPEEQQRQREARLKIFNDVLDVYRKAGAQLEPVEIPANITSIANTIGFVLTTEGAAAFDDLIRSKDINDPSLNTWPNHSGRIVSSLPSSTSAPSAHERSSSARWKHSCRSTTCSSRPRPAPR